MLPVQESPVFGYIQAVPAEGLIARLNAHLEAATALLSALPEDKAGYAYAPGKWTVRQLVGHLLVSQRVFVTRAVRIARGETKALTGYDENLYAEGWPGEDVPLSAVAAAYAAEAAATRAWLGLVRPAELEREGIANGTRLRPQEILRALIGHESHHLRVLAERYGLGPTGNS
jgi:uncharacterized damage-inducible protein DinB